MSQYGPVEFRYFQWSGRNSVKARTRAAEDLRALLRGDLYESPAARHVLIAHSHGATVVLNALDGADSDVRDAVGAVVLLSPLLLNCELVKDAAAAADKLAVGTAAALPLLALPAAYAAKAFGFSRAGEMVAMLLVLLAAVGRPVFALGRVRQRAEALAEQLALRRPDVPGVVIRAGGDEATTTLSCVTLFARLTRYAWSRILRLRPPRLFLRGQRRRADALRQAVVLSVFSVKYVWWLQDYAATGDWTHAGVTLPFALAMSTGLLVVVGGPLMLLLLLPAFSFLLWPFGIWPTSSAALLRVSVEAAPAPTWDVIDLPELDASADPRWQHSTYCDRAAIATVCGYLRSSPSLRVNLRPQFDGSEPWNAPSGVV